MEKIKHIPGKSLCLLRLLNETQKCILQRLRICTLSPGNLFFFFFSSALSRIPKDIPPICSKHAFLLVATSCDYLPGGSMGRASLQLSAQLCTEPGDRHCQ